MAQTKEGFLQALNSDPLRVFSEYLKDEARGNQALISWGLDIQQTFNLMRDRAETQVLDQVIKPCAQLSGADLDLLNLPLLEEKFVSGYYNPAFLEALSCILKWLAVDGGGIPIPRNLKRLRNWYNPVTLFGEPSAEGFVLGSNLKQLAGLRVVVKVAREPATELALKHEYFVGTTTNQLRSKIPNFTYVLGAFRCSKPTKKNDKLIICPDDTKPVTHVVYEYAGGTSLSKASRDIDYRGYLSYLVQLALSLQAAQEVGFGHFDLHTGNIVLRKWVLEGKEINGFYVRYPYGPGNIHVLSNGVAMIIDYGRAHVKLNGVSFGIKGIEVAGVRHNLSDPTFDIHRLLGFSLRDMIAGGNAETYRRVFPLFYRIQYYGETQLTSAQIDALGREPSTYNLIKVSGPLEFNLKKKVPYQEFLNYLLSLAAEEKLITEQAPPLSNVYTPTVTEGLNSLAEKLKGKEKRGSPRRRTSPRRGVAQMRTSLD